MERVAGARPKARWPLSKHGKQFSRVLAIFRVLSRFIHREIQGQWLCLILKQLLIYSFGSVEGGEPWVWLVSWPLLAAYVLPMDIVMTMARPFLLFLLVVFAAPSGTATGTKHISHARTGKTYLYTYYDRQGRIVINNLPPSYVQGQGLTLKHVGVGSVRLAISSAEMARVIKSPELIAMVDEICAAHGVDTHLARAIIQAESAFNYRARSHKGALGLMQLIPATAERFGVLDPFDPRQNITGGVKYLHWLMGNYKNDVTKVIAAYNAGEKAVDRYKGVPPYRETRAYVPKVMSLYQNKAVQPDPKASGAMQLLAKGRGGFKVDEKALAEIKADAPVKRASTRIYQWIDANGRMQISDQPPPKGTNGVRVFGEQ